MILSDMLETEPVPEYERLLPQFQQVAKLMKVQNISGIMLKTDAVFLVDDVDGLAYLDRCVQRILGENYQHAAEPLRACVYKGNPLIAIVGGLSEKQFNVISNTYTNNLLQD